MEPVDVKELRFREVGKLGAFPSAPSPPPGGNQRWLAASNGRLFVLDGARLLAIPTAPVYQCKLSPRDAASALSSCGGFRAAALPAGFAASVLTASGDGLTLLVGGQRDGGPVAALYDTRAWLSSAEEPYPFQEIRLGSTPGVLITDVQWNPVTTSTFAAALSDGMLAVFGTDPASAKFSLVANKALPSPANALSWSPKGKQVAAGLADGTIAQLTPELLVYRTFDAPSQAQIRAVGSGTFSVRSLEWLSTLEFAVAYSAASNAHILYLAVLTAQKAKANSAGTFVAHEDVCFGNGRSLSARYFFHHVAPWKLVLVTSSVGGESAVVGRAPGEARDEAAAWRAWSLDETGRAELPLPSGGAEPECLGAALDLSPAPVLALASQTTPVLWVLGLDGQLRAFAMEVGGDLGAPSSAVLAKPLHLSAAGERKAANRPAPIPPARPPPPPVATSTPKAAAPRIMPAVAKPPVAVAPLATTVAPPQQQTPAQVPVSTAAAQPGPDSGEAERRRLREFVAAEMTRFQMELEGLKGDAGIRGLRSNHELTAVPSEALRREEMSLEAKRAMETASDATEKLCDDLTDACVSVEKSYADVFGAPELSTSFLEKPLDPVLASKGRELSSRLASAEEQALELFYKLRENSSRGVHSQPRSREVWNSRKLGMVQDSVDNMAKALADRRDRLNRLCLDNAFRAASPPSRSFGLRRSEVEELTATLKRSSLIAARVEGRAEPRTPPATPRTPRATPRPRRNMSLAFPESPQLSRRLTSALEQRLTAQMRAGPRKPRVPDIPVPVLPPKPSPPKAAPAVVETPTLFTPSVVPTASSVAAQPKPFSFTTIAQPKAAPTFAAKEITATTLPAAGSLFGRPIATPVKSGAGKQLLPMTLKTVSSVPGSLVPPAQNAKSTAAFSFGGASSTPSAATTSGGAAAKPTFVGSTGFGGFGDQKASANVGMPSTTAGIAKPLPFTSLASAVVKAPLTSAAPVGGLEAEDEDEDEAGGISINVTLGLKTQSPPKLPVASTQSTASVLHSTQPPPLVASSPATSPAPITKPTLTATAPVSAIAISPTAVNTPSPPSLPIAATSIIPAANTTSVALTTEVPVTTVSAVISAVPPLVATTTAPIISSTASVFSGAGQATGDEMEDEGGAPGAAAAFSFAPSPPPATQSAFGGGSFGGASPPTSAAPSVFGGGGGGFGGMGLGGQPSPAAASRNVFGGGFGAAATAATASAQSGSIFGAAASPFGAQATSPTSPPSVFGGGAAFGGASPSAFGGTAPAAAGTGFGAAPAFGSPTGFGSKAVFGGGAGGSPFGGAASSGFGGARATTSPARVFGSGAAAAVPTGFAGLAGGSGFGAAAAQANAGGGSMFGGQGGGFGAQHQPSGGSTFGGATSSPQAPQFSQWR